MALPTPTSPDPRPMYDWARRLVTEAQKLFDETKKIIRPGYIIAYPGPNIPEGWIKLEAQVLKRAAYPALYSAVGDGYAVGGEAGDEFRLPDQLSVIAPGSWIIRS